MVIWAEFEETKLRSSVILFFATPIPSGGQRSVLVIRPEDLMISWYWLGIRVYTMISHPYMPLKYLGLYNIYIYIHTCNHFNYTYIYIYIKNTTYIYIYIIYIYIYIHNCVYVQFLLVRFLNFCVTPRPILEASSISFGLLLFHGLSRFPAGGTPKKSD